MNPCVKIEEFYSMDGQKKCYFKVIPARGVWLTFENDPMGNIFVSLGAARRIPFSLFLNLFEEKNENDPIYFLKFLVPGESYDVESSKKKVKEMFFDPENYQLSERVRAQLNGFLHNSKEEKPEGHLLTKEDVQAIGDFFKMGSFEAETGPETEVETKEKIKEDPEEQFELEKELLWLEIELDKSLEALYYAKNEEEKERFLKKLHQNRARFNELDPSQQKSQ